MAPCSLGVSNIPARSLDRRGVLRLQADAPVKDTGTTTYNTRKRGEAMRYSADATPDL